MKETTWVEKNQFKYKDGKYNESFTYESKVFVATQMVPTPKVWSYCENSKRLSMQQGFEGRKGLSLWIMVKKVFTLQYKKGIKRKTTRMQIWILSSLR